MVAAKRRPRHTDHVGHACATPDGFATASSDGTIKLWRPDGSFVASLDGHHETVGQVRLLAGGRLVSCSHDRQVLLRDLQQGGILRSFGGCKHWVVALAVSADQRRIATIERLGAMRVWDLSTGKLVMRHKVGAQWPSLALSPQGDRAFVGRREDGVIQVIDLEKRTTLAELSGHSGAVSDLAMVGDRLVSVGDRVRVWSLDKLAPVASFGGHRGSIVGLDTDGDFLATGDRTGFVLYWDLTRGPTGGRQLALDDTPTAFAARPDCSVLFGFASGEVLIKPPL